MWRATVRKARADLWGRPLQTALVFIVIVAAAATLSLALQLQANSDEPYERLRERSNGADAWVNVESPGADLASLRDVPGVEAVGEAYPVSWENHGIRSGDRKQQVALVGLGPTLPAFDRPVLTAGRWLTADGERELVLDAGAARLLDVRPSERITLLRAGGPVEFTLVGLAATASRAPAPINDPAFAYVLPETLRELHPGVTFGAEENHALRVGVRLSPGTPFIAFFEAARSLLPVGSAYRASTDVERNIADANQFNLIFLQVFGGFALIAAGLIVANSVGGQVLAQLRDIGVLKSIGFTPRQVLGALLVQNLGLAAIASVAGAALGTALAPVFLRSTAEVLGVPSTAPLAAGPIVTPIAVVLAVVLLFTLVPAWRAARISPIVALGRIGGDRPAGVSRLGTLGNRIGLPRTLAIGLADLARRKARATFTLFALMLAVITATFTLGIEATFDKTMDNPTVIGGPPFDLAIDRDTLEDAPARDLIAGDADVEEVLPTYWTGARVGRLGFDVAVYDGDLARQAWPIRSGRMPSAPGEVALGMVLRDSLGASLGDRLELQYGDGDAVVASVTVVGTYASTDGEVLATVPGTLQLDEPPSDYLVRLRSGANARTVANRLVAVSGGQLDPEVLAETVQDLRDSWRPLLVGLNAVLFGIAGINLMSNLMLGVRERRRELAVLKTVGFTPRQLVTSVVTGSVATALAATVLGIPLGLLATRVMFDVLSSAAGIGTGVGALPGIRWLVLLLPMAVGTAALASLIPAAGAARLRVAEALRHE